MLMFITGLLTGSLLGVAATCLLQINKTDRKEDER